MCSTRAYAGSNRKGRGEVTWLGEFKAQDAPFGLTIPYPPEVYPPSMMSWRSLGIASLVVSRTYSWTRGTEGLDDPKIAKSAFIYPTKIDPLVGSADPTNVDPL